MCTNILIDITISIKTGGSVDRSKGILYRQCHTLFANSVGSYQYCTVYTFFILHFHVTLAMTIAFTSTAFRHKYDIFAALFALLRCG